MDEGKLVTKSRKVQEKSFNTKGNLPVLSVDLRVRKNFLKYINNTLQQRNTEGKTKKRKNAFDIHCYSRY